MNVFADEVTIESESFHLIDVELMESAPFKATFQGKVEIACARTNGPNLETLTADSAMFEQKPELKLTRLHANHVTVLNNDTTFNADRFVVDLTKLIDQAIPLPQDNKQNNR